MTASGRSSKPTTQVEKVRRVSGFDLVLRSFSASIVHWLQTWQCQPQGALGKKFDLGLHPKSPPQNVSSDRKWLSRATKIRRTRGRFATPTLFASELYLLLPVYFAAKRFR